MSAQLETRDMLVVTVLVPTTQVDELKVRIAGNVAHVYGPGGFRRTVHLPKGADTGRLQAGLFADFLELRAPRATRSSSLRRREVEVRPLG
jgi:HSP20 family molecular chaperone IbpA